MNPLPVSFSAIRGLRVARWVRESTDDQLLGTGPESQMFLIDSFIEQYELVDSELAWTVSASGWKHAWLTPEWSQMVTAARAGQYDLLLVGYDSRYLRNLRQWLNSTEGDLHPAGVAVVLVQQELLSSNPAHWGQLVQAFKEAEGWSRTMSKLMKDGHAARRRRGEPGGHPPFGFIRRRLNNDPAEQTYLVEVPERIDLVRRMFEWSASGLTDREVSERSGRRLMHVREILTNPIYIGQLRDGNTRPAAIDKDLWDRVHAMRDRRTTRAGAPLSYRTYPLSGLLYCRDCGRGLIGDTGRYRHTDACSSFRAARPPSAHPNHLGDSYPAAAYDSVIPTVLSQVAANAALVVEVQEAINEQRIEPVNQIAMARIRREREAALDQFNRDRDVVALQATYARLDREEADATITAPELPSDGEIALALTQLDRLYREASTETQQRIARSLFSKVEVRGRTDFWLTPAPEALAQGWGPAMTGEVNAADGESGRGERI